jgi:hypothetical protein
MHRKEREQERKEYRISICYKSIVQLLGVQRKRKKVSWIHIILYQWDKKKETEKW